MESNERDMVIDLLRGIEVDLGWAISYRLQRFVAVWSLSTRLFQIYYHAHKV